MRFTKYLYLSVILIMCFSCKTIKNIPKDKYDTDFLSAQYLSGNYECVINELNGYSISNSKEEMGFWYLYGLCYMKQNMNIKALFCFEKVLLNYPESYELLNNIGVCYFQKKDYLNAMKYFHSAFVANTNYKIAIDNYNIAYSNLISECKEISAVSLMGLDEKPVEYNSIGWLYYYLDDIPDAVYYFKKSIKEDPEYQFSYISLGFIYDERRNYNTALQYLEKAEKIDDKNPDLLNNLGVLYYHLNRKSAAEKSFFSAIEQNNNFPEPYSNLGFIYIDENDLDKAVTFFERSIELNNENNHLLAESLGGLAIVYFKKGNISESKKYKEQSVKSDFKMKDQQYLKTILQWNLSYLDIWSRV
jgi:tetratricopeptide (TPR) repeat protein